MILYKKLCCGIFYLLRDKARSDIPIFATFVFILLLVQMSFYALESLFEIIFRKNFVLNGYVGYVISLIFAIPNYFFVFRNNKFLDYYHQKLPSIYTILIIVVVFGGSLALILLAGPRNVLH
jgi:hypothetical protein